MSLTNEQQSNRSKALGGSDAAAAVGLSPYKTPYALWLEKTGRVQPPDLDDNEAVIWGNVLEDAIAQEYMRRTGRKVRRCNRTLVHHEHPWMVAHIDRDIVGEAAGLEIKTASIRIAKEFGDPGSDDVPMHYLLQCAHYMAVTDAQRWELAALIAGNDFRLYTIHRDDRLIRSLISKMRDFWEMVESDTPPPPSTLDDCAAMWPDGDGGIVQANDEILECVERLRELTERHKMLESSIEAVKVRIQAAMGDASVLVRDGCELVTWKQRSTSRVDTKMLRELHPDIADACTKTSTSRYFLAKKGAGK